MKKFILPIFILLVLVQWLVPGEMIWKWEKVLLKGKEFKFETEPVDPIHPFMGRYLSLNFVSDEYNFDSSFNFQVGEKVYVEIKENEHGFAEIKNISRTTPSNNSHYIIGSLNSITGTGGDTSRHTAFIEYPFEEYYMEEFKAPKVEKIFRSVGRDSLHSTYAVVKVLNGDAVMKDLIIKNRSINNY